MPFKSHNMHYAYNKEYFDLAYSKGSSVEELNSSLFKFSIPTECESFLSELERIPDVMGFSLFTVYPGLMVGSGYPHNSDIEKSIVGGFSFDYITGLPIIPGPSLKGALRSWFKDAEKNRSRKDIVCSFLKKEMSDSTYNKLISDIFDGKDVFLGGIPKLTGSESIFAQESITPHRNKLLNPVPLSMIKVKPNVEYKFLFILSDSEVDEVRVSKEDKLKLFEELILLGGLGAKTNVGFGQFAKERRYEETHATQNEIVTVTITGFNDKLTEAYFEGKGVKGHLFCANVGAKFGKIDKSFHEGEQVKVFSKKDGKYTNWFLAEDKKKD